MLSATGDLAERSRLSGAASRSEAMGSIPTRDFPPRLRAGLSLSSGVALSFSRGGDIVEISEYRTSDRYAVSLGQSPRILGRSRGTLSRKIFEFWETETVFPAF